jgi:hypothetical protein
LDFCDVPNRYTFVEAGLDVAAADELIVPL